MAVAVQKLYFTGNDEADALLASEPFALLVGFALDQQVTVPTAFSGPLKLKQRIGTLDPGKIAATDPATLLEAFREKPAIHRFPGSMAERVQQLARLVVDEYGGDASRLWNEAADGADLRKRIAALPGFGEMKIKALGSVLAKRFGVEAAQELVPNHPTLGDVDSPEALERYQDAKRAYKAKLRAQGVRQRVLAYVTRERDGHIELLVFDQHGDPGAGTQVPAGRLDPGETLEQGLRRELHEEAGLDRVRIVRELPILGDWAHRSQYENHAFEVRVADEMPDSFEHVVHGDGDDAGLVFLYRWVGVDSELDLWHGKDPTYTQLR